VQNIRVCFQTWKYASLCSCLVVYRIMTDFFS
jgi:hypothetical protein